jgi:hypothetical protein
MRLYLLAFIGLVFVTVDSFAQDLQRGKMLHDTHCIACHDARIYTRENRVARDPERLRVEVDRWQKNTSLGWDEADIDAVTGFLAARYYGLDCKPGC